LDHVNIVGPITDGLSNFPQIVFDQPHHISFFLGRYSTTDDRVRNGQNFVDPTVRDFFRRVKNICDRTALDQHTGPDLLVFIILDQFDDGWRSSDDIILSPDYDLLKIRLDQLTGVPDIFRGLQFISSQHPNLFLFLREKKNNYLDVSFQKISDGARDLIL
jgi:hypothetical protein